MSEQLHEAIADELGQAQVLRHNGYVHDAELIERVCARVSAAAEEYLNFMSESEAVLRTGATEKWLRTRFQRWVELGHAKKIGRIRYYRQVVLEPRANLSAAREEGRRAAGGAA